jgi:hypothetical protein
MKDGDELEEFVRENINRGKEMVNSGQWTTWTIPVEPATAQKERKFLSRKGGNLRTTLDISTRFREQLMVLSKLGKPNIHQRPPRLVPRSTKASLLREQSRSQPKEMETTFFQWDTGPQKLLSSIESVSPFGGSASSSRSDVRDRRVERIFIANKDRESELNSGTTTKLPGPSRDTPGVSLRRSLSTNPTFTSERAKFDNYNSTEVTQNFVIGNLPASQPCQPVYQDRFSRKRSRSLGTHPLKGSLSQVSSSESFRTAELQILQQAATAVRSEEPTGKDRVTGRQGRTLATKVVWVLIVLFIIVTIAVAAYYFFPKEESQDESPLQWF